MTGSPFSPSDLQQLKRHGIGEAEALRQLELFRRPPSYSRVVRPCTPGDGVLRLDEAERERLAGIFERNRLAARRIKFVPASGAATRMFRDLLAREPAALERFETEVRRFAFAADLDAELRRRGKGLEEATAEQMVEALLQDEGLGYAELPKGLLKFHRYPDESRTPFEEHLLEAAEVLYDPEGVCRLHFTVSPQHRTRFEALFTEVRERFEQRVGRSFEVGYSTQSPSTDTLAVDLENRPFRDEQGALVLRPGGHGALIGNLANLDADVALLRNIDNVQPEHAREVTLHWQAVLGGLLSALSSGEFRPAGVGELDPRRPLRVCGVVPNTGEPGGGPFWVRGADGRVTPQIVETAQVDPDSEEQQRTLRASTHFNPVNMACALRDPEGRRYDLEQFVDHDAAIITRKSSGGRDLRALERPGLWNGAMAGWNTVFVEVPLETFTPVKTVFDLLRPEHQAG